MSAGAVLSIRDPSRSPEPAPPIVREVLRLIAETVCIAARPEEALIAQAEAHLFGLIERYGTMRLAMETLSSGGRRLPGISHEKAHAWSVVMSSSLAQVDSVLRRSPHLVLVVGKWVAAQGDTLEARLDGYQRWLDSPITAAALGDALPVPVAEFELAPPASAPKPIDDEGATRLARTLVEEKRAFEPGGGGRE